MRKWTWIPMMSADTGAEGGVAPTDATSTAEASTSEATADTGNAGVSKEKEPFAIFPDEASFRSRLNREAKKQFGEYIKSLGVEKEDELKSIIQTHRDSIEKSKSELDKARETAELALKEKTEFIQKYSDTLKKNEAKVKALGLGIKPERVDYVIKLLDLTGVEVEDGVVDGEAIEKQLSGLIKEFPELKGSVQPTAQKAGQDFSESKANPEFLSLDVIRGMSVDEVEKRLPEILKFMNNK